MVGVHVMRGVGAQAQSGPLPVQAARKLPNYFCVVCVKKYSVIHV